MESKRSDNRRRRVLYDEAVQQSASAPPIDSDAENSTAKRRRSNNYGSRRGQQLKTSDLIPTRWLTFSLIATCSLAVIGFLNLLQWVATWPSDAIDPVARAAFSLNAPNSLAAWFSSVGFISATLFGLQIFAMRRHRRDDYRGTYRVWLVLTPIFLLASLQCIVPLERIGATFLSKAIRSPAFVPGEMGLVGLKLTFLTAVFVRMVIEIRHSRSATALLVVAFLTFCSSALLDVPAIAQYLVPEARVFTNNLFLFGCLALLNSVIAYSRFVNLDMQGLLARRTGRSKKRRSRSANQRDRRRSTAGSSKSDARKLDDSGDRWSQSEKASTSPPPASSSPVRDNQKLGPLKAKIDAIKSSQDEADDEAWEDDDNSEDNSTSRLSKAERRRLKKLQRRHAA